MSSSHIVPYQVIEVEIHIARHGLHTTHANSQHIDNCIELTGLSFIACTWCRCIHVLHQGINCSELPLPLRVIEEWTKIISIVIRRILFSMVWGRQSGQLVTIDAVIEKETLHLTSQMVTEGHQQKSDFKKKSIYFLSNSGQRHLTPHLDQLGKHGHRSAILHLSQISDRASPIITIIK